MKLFIGGAFQNKLETARKLTGKTDVPAVCGEDAQLSDLLSAEIINHFHEFVRRLPEETAGGCRPEELAQLLADKNPDVVIVCNELGYGVVPASAEERLYREMVGRVTCDLAAKSEEVYRVICGIGVRIK